jgi:hypothetical protein
MVKFVVFTLLSRGPNETSARPNALRSFKVKMVILEGLMISTVDGFSLPSGLEREICQSTVLDLWCLHYINEGRRRLALAWEPYASGILPGQTIAVHSG